MKNKDDFALKQERKYSRVYLIGFFLILTLPLLNLPPLFSPPDWGKTIIFRIIFSTLLLIFFYQLAKRDFQLTKEKQPLSFWLLIGLWVSFFLATLFSLDPNFSLWGSPYRAGGFVNFSFYIIFSLLTLWTIKKLDWQKLWDFSITIGILVSAVALCQQFGLFSTILKSFSTRPPSTVGNPIFLSIYLLLLSFLCLAFSITDKRLAKKGFYFLSFLLFVLVSIFIAQTRAAVFGFAIGFFYFFLFYPAKNSKLFLALKISTVLILFLGVSGIYYISTRESIPDFLSQNALLQKFIPRLKIEFILQDPRISGWKIGWEAIKEKPVFGYGPENFSIGFDKHYDPSLPGLEDPMIDFYSWWDRAHSVVFDIAVTAGIPALIVYASLFVALLKKLNKLKKKNLQNTDSGQGNNIIVHGIQTTLIAYVSVNIFSFDSFSSYILFFLLIGYSLHLISTDAFSQDLAADLKRDNSNHNARRPLFRFLLRYKKHLMILALIGLIWFIWDYNLKPLGINKEINIASHESESGLCENALQRMEKMLPNHSILDGYLQLKYIEIIRTCLNKKPDLAFTLSTKATEALKENIKIRPYYTRNWLLAGTYTNILIEISQSQEKADKNTTENLVNEANSFFERACQLSPKRQDIFLEWAKTDLLTEDYNKAESKAQKCIDLNSGLGECYWVAGLAEVYLKDEKKADEFFELAEQNSFTIKTEQNLLQLIKAYSKMKDSDRLISTYRKLLLLKPDNIQYFAALAVAFKEAGDYTNARIQALKVLELSPGSKDQVEEFLKTLEH